MVEADVDVEGVGLCRRVPLGEVGEREGLVAYLPLSGFSTLQEWWSMIEHYIWRKDEPWYLYHVYVV